MSLLVSHNVLNAFIACAPRSVGGAFRIADARNPTLLHQGASPDVGLVMRREAMSVSLAWMFGLFTSALTQRAAQKLRVSRNGATLGVALISNILAESVARVVAYRHVPSRAAGVSASSPARMPPGDAPCVSLPPLFQSVAFAEPKPDRA